ncbi:acetyltransferase [Natronocella acetinitrilica]|uniref:Acetyltransferase n=1 Tax=Natronocella acetinitrilica TaxID=414046 RepID=A0AAE3G0R6_9GAMM|nr:acetate--CoA ligase family protein [Natronocella acetinitrilica]MCP1673630.1 acetyltransferase [Natronocella acetinitrilica]
MRKLEQMLSPQSIALVGASKNLNKLNGRPLKFLLEKGYAGRIFPINPNYESIADLPCYPAVSAVPEPVDLAVVMVPARLVPDTMRDLASASVPAAVVFSSGFSETGGEGAALEEEVRQIAREGGIALCGPNCLGLINSFEGVMASFSQFANGETPPGPVGFVTQSGAFGTAIAALARNRELGLGYFVNTGNEAGVHFSEVMEDVLADDRISVGAGYLEGLADGNWFARTAQKALELNKPLVVTKVGRTSAGAKAAASHTGALAGEDAIFQGVCDQFGVIRAPDEEVMLDVVDAFASGARPSDSRLGIITQSGGAGVLMADGAEERGLTVAALQPDTTRRLKQIVPAFGAVGNPVDITAQFIAEPEIFRDSVIAVMDDPAVDIGIVWFQLMHEFVDQLMDVFRAIREGVSKPVLVCWVAGPADGISQLRELGFPVFRSASAALNAAGAAARFGKHRAAWESERNAAEQPLPSPVDLSGKGVLPAMETFELLTAHGLSLTPSRLCATAEQAMEAAQALGFPVALKIESPQILHKTDIGGVVLGLADSDTVRHGFDTVMQRARAAHPDATIDGVLVQAMQTEPSVELVVGLKQDPVFGMVVMLGMGGTALEVNPDVVFRKAPVSEAEALRMLDQLRGRGLLGEVRGRPAVDRAAVARLVAATSTFAAANADQVAELDINPVLASAKGARAVDWLLISKGGPRR